jgi:hypothetical protein
MSTQPDIQPGILKTYGEQDRNAGYAKVDKRELLVHAFSIFTGQKTVIPLEAAHHWMRFAEGGLAYKKNRQQCEPSCNTQRRFDSNKKTLAWRWFSLF